MVPPSEEARQFELQAVHAQYEAERARRMAADRTQRRSCARRAVSLLPDRSVHGVRAPHPAFDEVDVVVVGGGLSGVITGVKLREAGIERIRFVDKAGGFGGTWYWNRYPGLMCDVESYIYMPMLEEMGIHPDDAVRVGRRNPAASRRHRREVPPRRRRALPYERRSDDLG